MPKDIAWEPPVCIVLNIIIIIPIKKSKGKNVPIQLKKFIGSFTFLTEISTLFCFNIGIKVESLFGASVLYMTFGAGAEVGFTIVTFFLG